jgi:hypothetical protein
LAVHFHVFATESRKGIAPLWIVAPLQENFQQYLRWAAHTIDRSLARFSLKDWATLHLVSVSTGSFKMECVTNHEENKSDKLSKACEFLATLSTGKFTDINEIKKRIGDQGLIYAQSLVQFVSELDLSLTISWKSESIPDGYLAIDKRRADIVLSIIGKDEPIRSIKIKLTKDEADPIRRPITGGGGMQSLLRKLQKVLTKENEIELTFADIDKIRKYGLTYGQGGFQGRLVGIAAALEKVHTSFQII